MQNPLIYWFRQDLRINDNPTLAAAAKTDKPIIAVYILDQNPNNNWALGSASHWWLHHSLIELSHSLSVLGVRLILRRGKVINELENIINETHADALYFSRQYEPYNSALEKQIFNKFSSQIEVKRLKGYLLNEPEAIRTGGDQPYKVFAPFYKACLKELHVNQPLCAPEELNAYKKIVTSDLLSQWNLLPNKPNWSKQFHDYWLPGENGALQYLNEFISHACSKYSILRNRPDVTGTSRLSAHLHFGEISPRQIWNTIKNQQHTIPDSGEAYLRQLIWRDFSYHLLTHWPDFPDKPFRHEFSKFPWQPNNKALVAWQKGQTGYPIVDAGMRELWKTGWMHNRVRMIVASFLIKDLLIPWQQGAAWFWDTLVDANLANNSAGWQWVAGCGADASPYFRVFNPTLQGEKFDPQGDYIHTWVPELKMLTKKFIHTPWLAPNEILHGAGITLGDNYPYPIVNHGAARDRALNTYKKLKTANA